MESFESETNKYEKSYRSDRSSPRERRNISKRGGNGTAKKVSVRYFSRNQLRIESDRVKINAFLSGEFIKCDLSRF